MPPDAELADAELANGALVDAAGLRQGLKHCFTKFIALLISQPKRNA
jgi:hypothetical protein